MSATTFWELAGFLLSLVQMLLYIAGFNKYRKRLNSLTTELLDRADGRKVAYKDLRDKDPEFYSYYKSLPGYGECATNIQRGRGAALASYNSDLRRSVKHVNGYSQAQRVNLTNRFSENVLHAPAMSRTITQIAERRRVDDHVLQRWQAIVSAPTNPSVTADYGSIIKSSFATMGAFGQGANSAGVAVGSLAFRIFG